MFHLASGASLPRIAPIFEGMLTGLPLFWNIERG